jgi:peptide deformylase
MAIRKVITHPHDILRRKAHKVSDFGPRLQKLIDDMVDTMRSEPGVGLAAPQVAESLRLIVVEYGEEEDEEKPPKLYTLINPEILHLSEQVEIGVEGCLSIPGYAGEVERAMEATIRGLNRRGTPVKIKATGWLARIFQHEIDHLNGILFIDRAKKVWKIEEDVSQPVAAV